MKANLPIVLCRWLDKRNKKKPVYLSISLFVYVYVYMHSVAPLPPVIRSCRCSHFRRSNHFKAHASHMDTKQKVKGIYNFNFPKSIDRRIIPPGGGLLRENMVLCGMPHLHSECREILLSNKAIFCFHLSRYVCPSWKCQLEATII